MISLMTYTCHVLIKVVQYYKKLTKSYLSGVQEPLRINVMLKFSVSLKMITVIELSKSNVLTVKKRSHNVVHAIRMIMNGSTVSFNNTNLFTSKTMSFFSGGFYIFEY